MLRRRQQHEDRPVAPTRRPFSLRRERTRGQALVEMALVVPVLLLMFAAAADFGRAFYAYVAIENAVKEGALFGSKSPICDDASVAGCSNPDNVTWRVRNETTLKNADGTDLAPTASCVDRVTNATKPLVNCAEGDLYVVALTYQFRLLTPIASTILGNAIDLSSESRATVLNLAFDPTPGLSVQKLVLASTARNGADVIAKCLEPDDVAAGGYYRSPCKDSTNNNAPLHLSYRVGDSISYRITVRNSGAQALTGVTITDNQGWPGTTSGCPARPTTIAVNATPYVCEYSRLAPAPAGSALSGDYVNVVTGDAANADPVSQSVTVRVEVPPADLLVVKSVSPYELGSDGDGTPNFGTTNSLGISYNATTPNPSVWYRIAVVNNGGQAATGFAVTDTGGPLPTGTTACPSVPSSLAVGQSWICRYEVPYNAVGANNTAAAATATNVVPDGGDSSSTAVTVTQCTGTNKVVPRLIGLPRGDATTVGSAHHAWTTLSQFTGTLTSWNNNPNSGEIAPVVTQSRQAFTCVPASSTMTITRDPTP